jgi:hypothetical protein
MITEEESAGHVPREAELAEANRLTKEELWPGSWRSLLSDGQSLGEASKDALQVV